MKKKDFICIFIFFISIFSSCSISAKEYRKIEFIKETIVKNKDSESHKKIRGKEDWYETKFFQGNVFYQTVTNDEIKGESYSFFHFETPDTSFVFWTIPNFDIVPYVTFPEDTSLMIINTLQEEPSYYDSKYDDYIWKFDLENLKRGIVKKDSVFCKYCRSCFEANHKWIFTKSNERDDLYDGFSLTDVYVSSISDLSDSVKVAVKFNVCSVSEDGRYIFAVKNYVSSERACVIIDSEERKYQIILGRDYSSMNPFYSKEEKKFGFDNGDCVIYIDMPQKFPFDALNDEFPYVEDEILEMYKKK